MSTYNWCKVLDHKPSNFTESGYVVCARCGSHGYWHYHEWQVEWFWWHLRLWWMAKIGVHDLRSRWDGWRRNYAGIDAPRVETEVSDDDIPF
jgi:hypothetical protein